MKSNDSRVRPFPMHIAKKEKCDFGYIGYTIPKILCPKCKDGWYMDTVSENHHKCPKCGYEINQT